MNKALLLNFEEALELTLQHVNPLPPVQVALMDALNQALSEDIYAKVDSPSIDASLKDGYSIISEEVAGASPENPVSLKLTGSIGAGDDVGVQVVPGTAVKVLTGARIPAGANAVVSEEFTDVNNEIVTIYKDAEPGRNILPKGSDVAKDQLVAEKGSSMVPGLIGLLAASGHNRINVVRSPLVAIIATGNEVIAPGQPLPSGKLYASNMATLGSWCQRYGMRTQLDVVRDDPDKIHRMLDNYLEVADAIVTSGGAWTSERDMVVHILKRLGWKQVFHRIRMGPGKAVGFGLWNEKPVFILPGGPPSNLMGFLQIALPGLLKLAGYRYPGLPLIQVQLTADLKGRSADWTQFLYGTLEPGKTAPMFHALKDKSRLRSMAEAQAIVAIPKGEAILHAGSVVPAQYLL